MSDGSQEDGNRKPVEESNVDLIGRLLCALVVISDPRKDRGKRHQLLDILAIAILGCMCGCDDAEALEDWANKEEAWLAHFLMLKHGIPSQDVFLRVLAALDPVQFREAFLVWMGEVFRVLGIKDQIAIDGQTNRGSGDRKTNSKAIHMVHALVCGEGLVVGQMKTEEKSNEITAIPELLRLLDLRGALVSIDAMGCQVKIAKQIKKQEGDYLLGLKGNQSTLHDETRALFEIVQHAAEQVKNVDEAQPPAIGEATDIDKGHGRIETRIARVVSDFQEWVPSAERWPEVKSLISIEAIREEILTGKITRETRLYISSRTLTPEEANGAVRRHWLVENQLHWCLDVTFGQDANQTRTKHAAENLAVIRHFALNLVRRYCGDKYSIPRRRRLCDYRVEYREKVLGMIEAS